MSDTAVVFVEVPDVPPAQETTESPVVESSASAGDEAGTPAPTTTGS